MGKLAVVSDALPAADVKRLDRSAAKIRKLITKTAQSVIEIGKELIAVKSILPHGEFGKWLEAEFGWGVSSAQKMMQAAEVFGNAETFRHLSIDQSALYILSAGSCPEEARREAIERAEAGEHISHKLSQEIREKHRRPKETESADGGSEVISGEHTVSLVHGDCLDVLSEMEPNSVDLVFGSPPYEDAREYGIDFSLSGSDWVDWMLDRVLQCVEVSRGLVAFVVEGRTKQYEWSATPVLLMARLIDAGVSLRKPVVYKRHGTPGSGGPDWFRNDYELVICCGKPGKLPWSDNTACGTPPKWGDEGAHRVRREDGSFAEANYAAPELVNPGNVVECLAGGGHTGPSICHENEAPFPEKLAELFIRSFCPPDGTVLDPFLGSGTTACLAYRYGRHAVGIDIRQSQLELTKRRLSNEQKRMFA